MTNSASVVCMHAKQGLPVPGPCRQQKATQGIRSPGVGGVARVFAPGRCGVCSLQAGSKCVSQSQPHACTAGQAYA